MSFFSRKFSLARGNFLTVGLNGLQPEIRVTNSFKTTLVLSLPELYVLRTRAATLMTEGAYLSSTYDNLGASVSRRCEPCEGKLRFVRQTITGAQPLDPSDWGYTEFVLESVSVEALLKFLPNVITISENIADQQTFLTLAYNIVGKEIKRLCQSDRYPSTHEYFPHIMQLLRQYSPISGLVRDFKKECLEEPTVNPYELFRTVLFQYEYIQANFFSATL